MHFCLPRWVRVFWVNGVVSCLATLLLLCRRNFLSYSQPSLVFFSFLVYIFFRSHIPRNPISTVRPTLIFVASRWSQRLGVLFLDCRITQLVLLSLLSPSLLVHVSLKSTSFWIVLTLRPMHHFHWLEQSSKIWWTQWTSQKKLLALLWVNFAKHNLNSNYFYFSSSDKWVYLLLIFSALFLSLYSG